MGAPLSITGTILFYRKLCKYYARRDDSIDIQLRPRYFAHRDGSIPIQLRHRIRAGLALVNFPVATLLIILLVYPVDSRKQTSVYLIIFVALLFGLLLGWLLMRIRNVYIFTTITLLLWGVYCYFYVLEFSRCLSG